MTADIQGAVSTVPHVSWPEGQLRQEVAARKRLVEAAIQLTSTFDSDKLLQLIMSSATELLDAETSSLMLVDEDTSELVIAVATGAVGPKAERQRIPTGAGIAGWTLANRQAAVVNDPISDGRHFPGIGETLQFVTRNLLAVPMLVKDRGIGVVEVINRGTTPSSPSGIPSWPPPSPVSPLSRSITRTCIRSLPTLWSRRACPTVFETRPGYPAPEERPRP